MARRHIRRCGDGEGVVRSTAKRGKRRRACDSCSKHKASCDGEDPCSRCRSKGDGCSYTRRDTDSAASVQHVASTRCDASVPGSRHVPIDFLLRISNPTAFSVIETLSEEVRNDIQDLPPPLRLGPCLEMPMVEELGEQTIPWDFMFSISAFTADLNPEGGENDPPDNRYYSVLPSSTLAARMNELVQSLRNTHNLMASKDSIDGPFDLGLASTLFTADNLGYFMSVYFQRVHVCQPIIHRPSFDCETAPLPLIAALFLFGSLYSTPMDHALDACYFMDVTEEFIFSHPTFRRLSNTRDTGCSMLGIAEIGILQAALTIIVAQNGINNKATRRRIRIERHPQFNCVLRSLGVFAARHNPANNSVSDTTRWENFIREESCIR